MILLHGSCYNILGIIDSLLSRVHKYKHLFAMPEHISEDIVSDFVVDINFLSSGCFGFLDGVLDSNELLA